MTQSQLGRHAVVIGAGIGGLSAACALADHFEQVSVLERDDLAPTAGPRAGTPQGRHVHALLAGGLQALRELFPGIEDDLRQAGAVPLRGALDVRVERPGFDPFPVRDLGVLTYSMSRPIIEFTLRQRVQRLPNVSLRPSCRVLDLVAGADGASVTGVRCEEGGAATRRLSADLVVDASGRGTPTLGWFEAMGRPAPPETHIGVDIGYASAVFEMPAGPDADWKGVMTFPKAPQSSRGALMLPLEGRCWMVSLGGRGGDKPPGDEAGFLEYARGLRTRTIHDAIDGARRVGDIARFAFPSSMRRHFEQLPALPRGLLPLGDVICRFNPVYGQGMSVAAQEGALLRRLLAEAVHAPDPLQRVGADFIEGVQALLETPWAMAAIPDFIFPETTGPRPPDLERNLRFGSALLHLAAKRPEVHKLMVEVQHLLKPRSVYRNPVLMARVMVEMAKL
ncbi:MAG TPA: FAD-dependent monooxygenase [Albitalea sp.]|uniref:FAD-dependent oxidoreductase n=1 Tax=Piscinibacter sp. TaxID=1903157 RepID=UPI002ED30FC8